MASPPDGPTLAGPARLPYTGRDPLAPDPSMRLTRFFLPLLKETPSEAQIASHRLMLRAGMIKQQAAGIYSWLPLGYVFTSPGSRQAC